MKAGWQEAKSLGIRSKGTESPGHRTQEQTQARTQGSLELHGKCVKKEVLEKEAAMELKSSWNERTGWHPVDGCNLGGQVGFCNDTCVVNTCNPHAQEAEAERWRT